MENPNSEMYVVCQDFHGTQQRPARMFIAHHVVCMYVSMLCTLLFSVVVATSPPVYGCMACLFSICGWCVCPVR